MGKIKSNNDNVHELNKEELDYITAVNETRNRRFEEDGRILGAFLKYIASSRLGYASEADLQFEIDFDSDDKKLKVTVLEHQD